MLEFLQNFLLLGLPIVIAITLHEAAHGYVALRYGDDTALVQGRVTLNPLKHVDLFGTLLLPGLLFMTGAPFIFGYAKPVPVDFSRLCPARQGMVVVALAGPLMNMMLAFVSALGFHLLRFMPDGLEADMAHALKTSLILNITLALFNMLPIPPLDGGRVAVGLLPSFLGLALARLERWGMLIVFTVLLIVPYVGHQLGYAFSPFDWLLAKPIMMMAKILITITGV